MACATIPLVLISAISAEVAAQTPPPRPAATTPPPGDAAFEASKAAFEALSEADRKAVQDALIWAGVYHGVVDGTFGKGTRDALLAFETREKLHADATVDAGELARLNAVAKRMKETVRFTPVTDAATGIRLGLPMRTLTKHTTGRRGSKYFSTDGTVSVETQVIQQDDTDLAKLYEKLKADGPDRKVTYKASKSDWFVVSGEAGDSRFYTRFSAGTAADGNELRGYTLTYPSDASSEFERVAIAMANSFEPFPAAQAATSEPPPKKAPPGPATPTGPTPPTVVAKPRLTATGVIVAPGDVLTVLPAACRDPASGKEKLTIVTSRADTGLTLLTLDGAHGPALAPGTGEVVNSTPLVVVGFVQGKNGASLGVAPGEALVRAGAEGQRGEFSVLAPLQEDASGSPVFDRAGALRGLVGRSTQKLRVVAGIVPEASYPVIGTSDLSSFLAGANLTIAPAASSDATLTTGDIATAAQGALVPVDCVR